MKRSATAVFGLLVTLWIVSGVVFFGAFLLSEIGVMKEGIPGWAQVAFGLSTAALIVSKFVMRDRPTQSEPTNRELINRAKQTLDYKPVIRNTRSGDYLYDDVRVAIPPAANCSTDYSDMKIGDSVNLVAEPSNPYDKNAVALYHGAKHIGYLYKGRLQEMYHDFDRRGDLIEAHISALPPSDDLKINLDFTKYGDSLDEDEDEYADKEDM